jgi:hypothetical protein
MKSFVVERTFWLAWTTTPKKHLSQDVTANWEIAIACLSVRQGRVGTSKLSTVLEMTTTGIDHNLSRVGTTTNDHVATESPIVTLLLEAFGPCRMTAFHQLLQKDRKSRM